MDVGWNAGLGAAGPEAALWANIARAAVVVVLVVVVVVGLRAVDRRDRGELGETDD